MEKIIQIKQAREIPGIPVVFPQWEVGDVLLDNGVVGCRTCCRRGRLYRLSPKAFENVTLIARVTTAKACCKRHAVNTHRAALWDTLVFETVEN